MRSGGMPFCSSASIRATARSSRSPYSALPSCDLSRLAVKPVRTSPGRTAQTRTPNGRSSLTRQSVSALTAALADE